MLDSIAFGALLASLCEYAEDQAFLKRLLEPSAIGVALTFVLVGFAIRDEFFHETIRYTLLSAAILIAIVNELFSAGFSTI